MTYEHGLQKILVYIVELDFWLFFVVVFLTSNFIYLTTCRNCSVQYVGQTKKTVDH